MGEPPGEPRPPALHPVPHSAFDDGGSFSGSLAANISHSASRLLATYVTLMYTLLMQETFSSLSVMPFSAGVQVFEGVGGMTGKLPLN